MTDTASIMPLEPILTAFGFEQSQRDRSLWRTGNELISVRMDRVFFDIKRQQGGAGDLQLVRYLRGSDSQSAQRLLDRIHAKDSISSSDLELNIRTSLFMPNLDTEAWHRASTFLTSRMGVKPDLVAALFSKRIAYASPEGHLVFVARDPLAKVCGGEIFGLYADTPPSPIMAPGSRPEHGVVSWPGEGQPPKRTVLVRNALEMMAWIHHFPEDACLSLSQGLPAGVSSWLVPRLISKGHKVVAVMGDTPGAIQESDWLVRTHGIKALSTAELFHGSLTITASLPGVRAAALALQRRARASGIEIDIPGIPLPKAHSKADTNTPAASEGADHEDRSRSAAKSFDLNTVTGEQSSVSSTAGADELLFGALR